MPIYDYECCSCLKAFEVAKAMSQSAEPERCPACNAASEKRPSRANFSGASDWNNQTFHPALGCYTKSDADARKIAKSRGLEEVGSEPPEKIHKHYETQRADKAAARWKDADRVKQFD